MPLLLSSLLGLCPFTRLCVSTFGRRTSETARFIGPNAAQVSPLRARAGMIYVKSLSCAEWAGEAIVAVAVEGEAVGQGSRSRIQPVSLVRLHPRAGEGDHLHIARMRAARSTFGPSLARAGGSLAASGQLWRSKFCSSDAGMKRVRLA